jgi:hypothetical protein
MKYFIGKKFSKNPKIIEEIMSFIEIEKEDNQTMNEIKSKIKGEICRNIIEITEVEKQFVKYITLFLEDEIQNIIGFLIFDINYNKSYIEIHYLCSMETYKGNGKILLDKIKEYATTADIDKIVLTPGLDKKIIKYYIDNGFEAEGWEMIYTRTKGGKTIRKLKTKKRINTQKNKKTHLYQ